MTDLKSTELEKKTIPSSSALQLLKRLDTSDRGGGARGRFSNLQDGLARLMGSVKKMAQQFKLAMGYAPPSPGPKPIAGPGLGSSRASEKEEDSDGN